MWEEPSFERQQEVLNSPFDINTHKETFVSYLEAIMDENGEVFYAVPSHQHKLCEIYMQKFGKDYDSARNEIVEATWTADLDIVEYLCTKTNCLAIWFGHYRGYPNEKQLKKLEELFNNGVYAGPTYDINVRLREEIEKWKNKMIQEAIGRNET